MLGHGSPSSFALALASSSVLSCAVLADRAVGQERGPAALPAIAAPAEPPITPAQDPLRLQLTWGDGEVGAWIGRVQVDRGTFTDLALLGLDADAAGSAWLDGGQLRIGDLSPHKSDSIEVTAEASPDAKLIVELASGPAATPAHAQVPLADLAKRPFQIRLDDRGNTLDVAMVPKPVVQILIKRDSPQQDSLIFSPGQQLSFEATLELPGSLHGTTVDIQTTLSPARRTDAPPLWADSLKLNVPVTGRPKIDLNVPLQQPEGVYTVRVAVSRPSGYFRDKFFAGAAAVAERTFDIVVIDPRPAAAAAGRWSHVLEIDPTNPGWIDRLPSWTQFRRIPGLNLNHGPLGSIRAGTVSLPAGRFIELPPTAPDAESHWQAYTLPLEAVGEPHILEVDYPVAEEQHFGLTILEPNAAGVVDGAPRDVGVFVEGLGRAGKPRGTQRVLFWPRTQTPLLVVTNRHPTAAARFGPLRVQRRIGPLADRPADSAARERLMAAFVARPLVAETFGATQTGTVAHPVVAPRSLDDLQTFYESATRLSDHLRHGGYNAAVVSALADGSSIFPLASSSLTPIYDSGRLMNRLQESDGLELALRVFDRDGLTLIPAVELAAPLAQLEELRRRSDPRTSGLEWVGPDGRTWLEANGSRGGLAPYYNLLDPRVQQAVLKIVAEIVGRYGNHAAFGGLAVQLNGDGYMQLPPPEWGLDDVTIARFERATGISVAATGPERFAARHELIVSQYADSWRSWRATEVARFYGQLAGVVRGNTDRRLLLTTEKLFDHPQIGQRIRPRLLDENRIAATLTELGLDRQMLDRTPGLVLCPTCYVGPTKPLCDSANDLELNQYFAGWRQQSSSDTLPGAVLYHRSKELRLPSFAARIGPTLRLVDELRITCEPTASGADARRPYLEALAVNDPAVLVDGGDLLPLSQDEKLREIRAAISRLPALAQGSEIAKQPVVARTIAEDGETTIVVMNVSPWAASARVKLEMPRGATLEPLADVAQDSNSATVQGVALAAGHQSWSLDLEPYDLRAVRIAVPGAKAVDIDVDLSGEARAELKAQLDDLTSRDLSSRREYRELANPSFEPIGGAAQVPGWRLSKNSADATVQLDATAPQDGKTCLYFRNNGQFAAIESDSFRLPATGQLTMTVYARGKNTGPGAELRLAFELEDGGRMIRRASSVRCSETERPNPQWGRPLAILFNDLPMDSRGKMRVVFEITGPGEMWLDNIIMYDLLFPLSWYGNAKAETFQLFKLTRAAETAYEKEQISDCLQLLDGYWPRFVMTHTPPVAPKVATLPAPASAGPPDQRQESQASPAAPPANEGQQPVPGVSDRLKRWMPILR
jgi:hypothetical protein